jgi:hypothetical protein
VDYYIYEPKAFVGHRVLEERVLRTWGLRRAFDHGRSISILKTFYNNKEWQHWISTSFQAVPKIFEKICVALTKLIRRKNNEYFEQLINSAIWVGIAWNSIGQGLALKINYEKQVRKLQA